MKFSKITFVLILLIVLGLIVGISCTTTNFTALENSDEEELDALIEVDPSTCIAYKRDLYKHWIDADGDCQDTRQEVLNAENKLMQSDSCRILKGKWIDPYTGKTYESASDLDIDHQVPLAEAHRSGAYGWDSLKREHYANDLSYSEHLVAIYLGENRSKGDRDPALWLPDSAKYWKAYVKDWLTVKVKWDLTSDRVEMAKIKEVLGADTVGVKLPTIANEVLCTGLEEL